MKKLSVFLVIIAMLFLPGCGNTSKDCDIVTTTLPVFEFTIRICDGTDLTVDRLVAENVSCLHDYTLDVRQMRMIESADILILSGAGLEDFLEDALSGAEFIVDTSADTHIHAGGHHHDPHDDHGHDHSVDPHIWLSPENAALMAKNICKGLTEAYPQYNDVFQQNLDALTADLKALQEYGNSQLSDLPVREMITFHDGFAYFAESFDLTILEAIEEESGSEASAQEIIHLAELVTTHRLPAVFTETNGSDACAGILSAETGAAIYTLDMAMGDTGYFDAMYHNIDTVKEALG